MGTQKNRIKTYVKLMGKKIFTILRSKFCLSKPVTIFVVHMQQSQVFWPNYNLCHTSFSAGLDTSRFTIQFALLHMAAYPEIQKKVREEIDNVVGEWLFLVHIRSYQIKNSCILGYF